MALQLLHEASLGGASRLAAYVRALPRSAALDTPLQWRPEELAALRYPHLQAEVKPLSLPLIYLAAVAAKRAGGTEISLPLG